MNGLLAPVPPCVTASVPDIVIVPAVVTGPPENAIPDTLLETSMLVTVPAPVSVLQVGAPTPLDDNT